MVELQPEERTGFEPEVDEETFLAERSPYPGTLPWLAEAEPEQETESTVVEGASEELPVQLDEDVLRYLREEIERSQARRRKQTQQQLQAQQAQGVRQRDGVMGQGVEIDLTGTLPRHPSQFGDDSLRAGSTESEVVGSPLGEEQSEGSPPKRRRIPVEALLVVLVLAGGGLLWYYSKQLPAGKAGGQPPERTAPGKSVGTTTEVAGSVTVHVPFRQVTVVPPLEVAPYLPLLQVITTTTPNPTTTTKTTPHTPHSKPSQHSTPIPTAAAPTEELFVVQVYASPVYEDAAEVAQQLSRRGLPNVSVSSAMIRGQMWWRVRFGPYVSRLQAEQAAVAAGFSQAWIVRLR